MAEVDQKVMEFVEETLKKTPKIELEELFEKARKVSTSIGKLTKRQFNARYPLQVKRKAAQTRRPKGSGSRKTSRGKGRSGSDGGRGSRSAARGSSAHREKIRKVLLQFASDIAGAEERKDLVKVLANVDRYVDQVV